jgi:DivIVA domain-containing protein
MDSLVASLRQRSFSVARRGYDRSQVDEFLDELATSIATLEDSARDALIQNREIERRRLGNREVEESVESTYVAAAEAKQKLLSEAENRAAMILRDAEIEAARLLSNPRAAADRLRRDAEGILRQAQARLEAAAQEANAIEAEAKRVLGETEREADAALAAAAEEAERIRSEATGASREEIAAAHEEAATVLADARNRAAEVYEEERRRSIERFAESRDEYEEVARHLRALKEATGDMLTNALRDYGAIRLVLEDSSVEIR